MWVLQSRYCYILRQVRRAIKGSNIRCSPTCISRASTPCNQQVSNQTANARFPTYQQLSKQFGDTPEGQRATNALKANQPGKGHFINTIPNDPSLTPTATLVQGLRQHTSDSEFYQLLSTAPTATIQSNGDFVFNPLPQGTYDLAWGIKRSDGNYHFQSTFYTDGTAAYVARIGPLCPYDFGDINETIPTS